MSLGSQVKILPQPNRSPFKHGSIIGKWSSLKFYLHPKKWRSCDQRWGWFFSMIWPKKVFASPTFRAMGWPRSLRPATPPISLHIWSIFHLRLNVPVLDCARMQCQQLNCGHGFVQKLSENKIVNHHFPIEISQNNNFAWFPIFRQTPYSSILDILA